ncbi:MAG: TonB-dependent receptor [Sphingomicrobium sp.]
MFVSSVSTATARALRCGASTLAVACAVMQPATAWAQDLNSPDTAKPLSTTTDPDAVANPLPPAEKGAIIVTGTRRALRTSQQIKRNADTVVDSITATDIGAFPDKSVAEALQRVPGITVNRFAASSDTAHFSAEPSGVLVRGLPQVRSEFNGRDTFSADSSRGLSWGDISPELMAGVDTYKNQTADLIEGGIAGSINLRTRVPFDADGQLIQASVNLIYGDLARKATPELSVFYSNRWQTGIGDIGIMLNGAYSKVITRSEGIQYMRGAAYDNAFGPDGPALAYVPSGIAFRDNAYNRVRKGGAAAFQWRSLDHKWLMTAQYNRSDYSNVWRERGVQNEFASLYGAGVRTRFGGPGQPAPGFLAPPGTAYTFGSDGVFQSGTFTRPNVGWFGAPTGTVPWDSSCTFQVCAGQGPGNSGEFAQNDQGQPMFYNCYGWAGAGATAGEGGPLCATTLAAGTNGDYQGATDLYTISRYAETFTKTQDASINLKWEATDRLRFNFDGQYVNATTRNYDIEIDLASFTTPTLDASGSLPRVVFGPPVNVNQSAGGLANPNNYYVRSVMDHMENAKGTEWAGRADGEYDIGTTWLNQLKFGARYSDRDQQVNWAAYNWQNVSNTWTSGCAYTYFNLDSQPATCTSNGQTTNFNGYPANFYTMDQFGQPFHGGNLGTFPFVPFDFLQGHGADGFSFEKTGVGNFLPECDRHGQSRPGSNNTNGGYPVNDPNSPGGCYAPVEITTVSESTRAGYIMLKFGGPDAHMGQLGVSGNIGLRFVNTVDHSPGFLAFPTANYNTNACPPTPLVPGGYTGTGTPYVPPPTPPGGTPPPPQVPFPAYCYLSAEDIAFAGGGGSYTDARASHNNFLPSFNVRFDISPKWLIRFALSKAMSRPDIGQLKNIGSIGQGLPTATAVDDPRYIKDSAGNFIGVTPEYTGSRFNPYLKPITAWQADVSLENYFANVGSFTIAAFYKKFYDYIQFGPYNQEVTANGVTRPVQLRGPLNGSGAEIEGLEVAYQRFFDFLPNPFDGLGIQANFTLVDNHGITNTNLTSVGSGAGDTTTAGTQGQSLNPGSLEGLSKYSFNLVGMYEKGPLAVRLAYNWRSSYLVTAYDCCVYLPVWQKAAGFLDGTIRYAITPQIELNLKGSNLLNTQTRLLQQITDDMDPEGKIVRIPNAYFINDRRFEIGARMKFGGTAPPPPAPPPVFAPPPPAPAMQTCADGSAILATDVCPAPPPPPPPPAPVERGERGL